MARKLAEQAEALLGRLSKEEIGDKARAMVARLSKEETSEDSFAQEDREYAEWAEARVAKAESLISSWKTASLSELDAMGPPGGAIFYGQLVRMEDIVRRAPESLKSRASAAIAQLKTLSDTLKDYQELNQFSKDLQHALGLITARFDQQDKMDPAERSHFAATSQLYNEKILEPLLTKIKAVAERRASDLTEAHKQKLRQLNRLTNVVDAMDANAKVFPVLVKDGASYNKSVQAVMDIDPDTIKLYQSLRPVIRVISQKNEEFYVDYHRILRYVENVVYAARARNAQHTLPLKVMDIFTKMRVLQAEDQLYEMISAADTEGFRQFMATIATSVQAFHDQCREKEFSWDYQFADEFVRKQTSIRSLLRVFEDVCSQRATATDDDVAQGKAIFEAYFAIGEKFKEARLSQKTEEDRDMANAKQISVRTKVALGVFILLLIVLITVLALGGAGKVSWTAVGLAVMGIVVAASATAAWMWRAKRRAK